jgi:hypothetical protein
MSLTRRPADYFKGARRLEPLSDDEEHCRYSIFRERI